jgi:hypothetical protein
MSMEIKSSNYTDPFSQNIKAEPVNNSSKESIKIAPATLQDDVVILSQGVGAHPERPPKP